MSVGFREIRRASRVAAFAMTLATVGLAASCRDMITDDVIDAEAALCGSFEACEVGSRACERVTTFFDSDSEPEFEDYLGYYQEWRCGSGCGSVEVCLDHPALCVPKQTECAADFDCCDASTGAAACKDARCCYDLGVVCETADDCCPLADGTEVGCFTRREDAPTTCGGLEPCVLRDGDCEEDDDCCGEKSKCVGGQCETDTCVPRDAPCRGDEACCVDGDSCREGICQPPDAACDEPDELLQPPCCTQLEAPCLEGGSLCCGGAICTPTLKGEAFCRAPNTCGPPGTACDADEDCCENGTDAIGCVGVDLDGSGSRVCGPIGCQLVPGAPCGDNGLGCCTGLSCLPSPDAGEATTCQEPCSQRGCHDIREFGAPLDPECLEDEQQAECARQICEADPFCCCHEWSPLCIDAAVLCLGPEPAE
jgi:hypothetical protein